MHSMVTHPQISTHKREFGSKIVRQSVLPSWLSLQNDAITEQIPVPHPSSSLAAFPFNFKNKWRGSQSGVLVQGWPADHRPHPQRLVLSAIPGVVSTHVLCAQLSYDTNGWTKFIKREAGREVCWPSSATTSCVTLQTFSLSGSPFHGLLPTSLVWLASCFFCGFKNPDLEYLFPGLLVPSPHTV